MDKKLKWGCIQPLTGGMYIGARNAIGHDAEWIISYKGLADTKTNKEGIITSAGNEYSLLTWLNKHDINVPYFTFGHAMFNNIPLSDVELSGTPDFNDIDIVVAVPVCSGLSAATIADQNTKDTRNGNMVFITKYTLGVIKPKVYVFENAPALFSKTGAHVREMLDKLGEEYGYSVIYYKTDTKFHDNCQRRPRTFVVFVKYRGEDTAAPDMGFEHLMCSVDEYLSRIPEGATQNEPVEMDPKTKIYLDFFLHHYGSKENVYKNVKHWMLQTIQEENLWDELYDYVANYTDAAEIDKTKLIYHLKHCQSKILEDLNYYSMLPSLGKLDTTCACMFKSVPSLIHYKEYRLYTIREWLHIMGLPHDFELQGDVNNEYAKIGQNVPVRTAQFIVSEAKRFVDNWETIERVGDNVKFVDNTKVK